ncbi:hypothetical protein [Rickettsia endosymbiont of Pantilius tunicatus]|uniref:hypothetical protein n=1 Tax=Rickettsia endosymbiont of Pantilius tunicatus TaxID=3066267 RepID=UPI0030DEA6A8
MLYIYTLTIVAIIFIWQNSREQLQNFVKILLISLVGFILYFIFRVELYLTHFVKQEAEMAACYSRYLNSYTIIFCFVIISFIKNSFYNLNVKFKNLIWFYIVTVVLSIVSLKYTINKLVNVSNFSDVGPPIERQNKLKDLIQSGIKDGSEFKEHDFKLLDCFIYNYLEAPNTDKYIFKKCFLEGLGRL